MPEMRIVVVYLVDIRVLGKRLYKSSVLICEIVRPFFGGLLLRWFVRLSSATWFAGGLLPSPTPGLSSWPLPFLRLLRPPLGF